jgi:phosphohistidine phosphatase
MKLYLTRHGIALDRIGGAIKNDFQRPLTQAGIDELGLVVKALKRLEVGADLVIASPLIRAKQTAEIIRLGLGTPQALEISEALCPGAPTSDLFKALSQFTAFEQIFLVGHEPDMSRIAGTLLWCGAEFNMPFKKAGIARIDISDVPPSFPGRLKWFLTPKIMSQIAN